MDDIKNNPFLAAYVAVLVIGAGVLGFFAYKAYSGYKDSVSAYNSVKRTVDGLKGQDFYPNEKNQETRTEEVQEFSKKVVKLETELQKYQPEASEGLDVPGLQVKIRKNIEEVRESASLAGVTIVDSEGFRLGMEGPLTISPRADAVKDLDFQLTAARQLADLLIESKVESIDEMGREKLEVEEPPKVIDPRAAQRAASRNKDKKVKEPLVKEGEVIKRYPLKVTFTADLDAVQSVLNKLSNTPEGQVFFSTRYLRFENEKKEGPEKAVDVESSRPDENPDAVSVIIGNETLRMQLVVDAIRFVSREEAEAAKAKAKEDNRSAA